jgi:methylmalonyl-CoA/ethylmalonyl-CoA epimerase
MGGTVQLNKLGQVAFQVSDLSKIEYFYKEILGLKHLFTIPDRMTFFDCDGVRLMLAVREPNESVRTNSIIYFQVNAIEFYYDQLKQKNVEFIESPKLVAEMQDYDLWMAFFKDIEGNAIGLMEEKRKK